MTDNDRSPSVSVAAGAWDVITQEAQQSLDGLETGGILLGRDTASSILVQHAGTPGPKAHRAPREFLRDLDHAKELAAAAWQDDRSVWIGDWHTHPSTEPVPSPADINSYLRHLHDPELQFEQFVTIVVVLLPGSRIAAAVWLVHQDRIRLSTTYTAPTLTEPQYAISPARPTPAARTFPDRTS